MNIKDSDSVFSLSQLQQNSAKDFSTFLKNYTIILVLLVCSVASDFALQPSEPSLK